ncbi:MAG TPA: hypothetical protein VHD63_13385 [Ktedonobacteraceae bacterium]|nr:hypothetical protein [Ktedonobacteraceae bacterium]
MEITRTRQYVREEGEPYMYQETLAAAIARGRHEEHQRACLMIHRVLAEIAETRYPLIALFLRERIARIDSLTVLHQFIFVMSTAWTPEDVLRFILTLDDMQANTN